MAFEDLHFAGYHGTSISNAKVIEEKGFQTSGSPICFAPMDNLFFALNHGQRRSQENGDSQYGVVQASFPAQRLEFGLGGDQINVPASLVGEITVRAVLVFDALPSGLLAPRTDIEA